MDNPPNPQQKEDKALLALITATLHVREDEVGLEEIKRYLEPNIDLTPEDEAAINRFGSDPFASAPPNAAEVTARAQENRVMALNRKNTDSRFSAKTTEELDRKRKELLEKLRKRQKST